MKRAILIGLVFILSGCRLPEIRIGQAEVPEPLTVTPEQREAWRQGADYVAKTIETPVETVYVADELSSSLGAPENPLVDSEEVIRELREAYRTQEQALQRLNSRLEKYEGKEIEGTGFDILRPIGGLGMVGLIAVLIFVPGAFSVLMFILSRTRKTLKQVIRGVGSHLGDAVDHPLKTSLSKTMDETSKALVKKLK